MMNKYDLDNYIKEQLSQGQLLDVLSNHLMEHTDALIYIVTKHNGDNMSISRSRKHAYIKSYIEEVQRYA